MTPKRPKTRAAAAKPRDSLPAGASPRISCAALAKRLGVSRAAVSKAVTDGRIEVGADGLVDAEVATLAFAASEIPAAGEPSMHTLRAQYLKARVAEVEARTRGIETENRRIRGELVPLEIILPTVGKAFANVRARLLALPSALAPQLAVESDPAAVFASLTRAITEVLTELSAPAVADEAVRKAKASR